MTSSLVSRVGAPRDSGRVSRALALVAVAAVLLGMLGMHSIAFGTAAAATGQSHHQAAIHHGSSEDPSDPCAQAAGAKCCVIVAGSVLTAVPFPAPSLPLVPSPFTMLADASHLLMATEAPTHPPSYAELSVVRV